jgi:hypothetical protein
VTDPAGKWKKYTTDVLGQLVLVDEPNPAGAISIYGTGLSAGGTLGADGTTDAHYTMVSSADASYPGPAAVVVNSSWPVASGVWIYPNGPASKWIGPRADAANGNSAGNYTYRTTFSLSGVNPSTAILTGWAAADDTGIIKLNGVQVASIVNGFASPSSFTISSGFQAGANTLDFVVTNGSGPTGLRVEISGTATPTSGGDYLTTYTYL